MAERDSGWVTGAVVDAEDARLATGVLVTSGVGPVQVRSGIKPGPGYPGLVKATTTPSRNVTVNAFQAVIQGTRTTAAGPYLATSDAVKSIDVLAVPAHATLPRRDLLIVQQTDTQYGDQSTGLQIKLVPGTPAATPVDPTVTGDYLLLARITVAANATAITAGAITDLRTWTAATGAIIPVNTVADRPANPHTGQAVYVKSTGVTEISDGGGWRPIASGGVQVYGPADQGWPKDVTSTGAEVTISVVTVPAVPYPRTLLVTAQSMLRIEKAGDRFDLYIATPGSVWGTFAITAAFDGALQSAPATAIVPQPSNTVMSVELRLWRAFGTRTCWASGDARYTSLNVLAVPLAAGS